MHRVLALLLVPTLVATSGLVSLLHTHAYQEHDHPEHHHGLAAHDHHVARSRPDDGTARLEGCDPGEHLVSFVFICAAPPQVHVVDAELTPPAPGAPDIRFERTVRHADVRVHGPPSLAHASPRAPPLLVLA